MLEPIESTEALHAVTVTDEQQLLKLLNEESKGLAELDITTTDIPLNAIIQLIEKYHATLQKITLNGPRTKVERPLHKIALMIAILKCSQLTALRFIGFKTYFMEIFDLAIEDLFLLPKLQTLGFQNTFLGKKDNFAKALGASTTIEVLDLEGCDLMGLNTLCEGIRKNRSLTTLNFGSNPIFASIRYLYDEIIKANNTIRYVNWEPLDFLKSELAYIEMLKETNPKSAEDAQEAMDHFYRSGHHRYQNQYVEARQKFDAMQSFLQRRRAPGSGITQFTVTIQNHRSYKLDLACTKFYLERETLTHLTLEFPTLEEKITPIEHIDKNALIEALEVCQNIQEIKFINLQGYLRNFTAELITTLAKLPQLAVLEFIHTYLGDVGAEALGLLFANKTLREVRLAHVGFINESCFNLLTKALQQSTTILKINFSSSPMTIKWIRLLANFIFNAKEMTLQKMEWSATNFTTMKESFLRMCCKNNHSVYVNRDFDYYYQQFCDYSKENLVNHWLLLQELLTSKVSPTLPAQKNQELMESILATIQGRTIETAEQQESLEEGIPLKSLSVSCKN